MQGSTIDRQNRANLGIVVTKGHRSFFSQVWRGPFRSKMRSSHIVSDAPQALHNRAMNNEISPTRKTAGKAKKNVQGPSALVRLQARVPSSRGNNLCICDLRKNIKSLHRFIIVACTLHLLIHLTLRDLSLKCKHYYYENKC